jgi:hypothetical protein
MSSSAERAMPDGSHTAVTLPGGIAATIPMHPVTQ